MSSAEQHYLVLYPVNPAWIPDDLAAFVEHLRHTGLIDKSRQPGLFSTGPAYLELITYLGCSPQISLGEAETATTIRLNGPYEKTEFRSSAKAKPRCRLCWQTLALDKSPVRADEVVACMHCKISSRAAELDWRHKAGFGRFFIEISNVYESEAVPSETLLDDLRSATGQDWDYFYWQDE